MERTENIVTVLEKEVWQIFSVLRSEPIPSSEYYFVLFLLSLYKDGYLDELIKIEVGDFKSYVSNHLQKLDFDKSDTYKVLSDIYEPIIKRISTGGLISMFKILSSIEQNHLSEHFPELFDTILYRLSKSQGWLSGQFTLPQEISKFVTDLSDLSDYVSVYNPFAGLASFGVFRASNQQYLGQEINEKTWALGHLRLMAYDRLNDSELLLGDSVWNWNPTGDKFDLIVANPPLGLRINRQLDGKFGRIRGVEQFVIEKGIESLKDSGKLIIVIAHGFLFRSGQELKLRKHLVNADLLESIISFPGGLLMNTGLPIAIVVINKSKKVKGTIRFIDAESFVISETKREKALDHHALYSAINDSKNSEVIKTVTNEEIQKNGFNLSVTRYFKKHYDGTPLRDLIEWLPGVRQGINDFDNQTGKFIRIRDLQDDEIENELAINSVEDVELPSISKKIDESCLLLAARWKSLRPTYFHYTDKPIYISRDIYAFRVDEEKIDIRYLIHELHADYVTEQCDSYRVGTAVPNLKKEDLLNVRIKLRPIREQRAKVLGLEEFLNKIKSFKIDRNALVHGVKKTHFDEFASLKHTLGAPRQNILSYSKSLIKFFENNQSESLKEINNSFRERYGQNLLDVFREILHDINYISEILEKGENGLILKEYELRTVSLFDYNKTIKGISENGFNFTLKKPSLDVENPKERGIRCNLTLLEVLLHNILTNANKYGFEEKRPENEVIIDSKVIEDFLVLEIRNNGKPFPSNFNKEKFIAKFSTSDSSKGSGLGGYDINRIAEYFDSRNWELILNRDDIYSVIFKFNFPIKPVR